MARNRDQNPSADVDWGDPWEDTPSPALSSDQFAESKSSKPAVSRKRTEAARIGAMAGVRKRWERSPVGQARTQDITDLATARHNELAEQHPDRLSPISHTQMNPAQIYHAIGVQVTGHGHGESQLPGFENPHRAPEPPRWEDLEPEQRAKTEHRLKAQGTNVEQMSKDYGAQLDQAVWRAHMAGSRGTTTGRLATFTQHFYDKPPEDAPEPLDRPDQMLKESRERLGGMDPSVHTAVVSHVSPNTKFTQGPRGQRSSPNIEAAEAVVKQVHEGVPWYNVTSGTNRAGVRNQSRPANSRRAAYMLEQVGGGTPAGQARNPPSTSNPLGSSQFGPKTGPFVNSFDAHHPDFLVADVHTGGGGMFPHLSTSKPLRRNKAGELSRTGGYKTDERSDKELQKEVGRTAFQPDKSQREKAMESGIAVPGSEGKKVTFHSAADYAARQAGQQRGLGTSVRQHQAMQWGEEQIQRKAAAPKLDLPTHADAYPTRLNHEQFAGQGQLF